MKNLILFLIIIFFSCQLPEIQDDWYSFKFDKVKFNSIEEVQEWVNNNIDYISDIKSKGKEDYWRYPSETFNDGEGDCEDMANLIIAIVRYQLEYKCNLVGIKNSNYEHAIIRYKGDYYDSTSVGKYKENYKYAYEYEYYEIPYMISTKMQKTNL